MELGETRERERERKREREGLVWRDAARMCVYVHAFVVATKKERNKGRVDEMKLLSASGTCLVTRHRLVVCEYVLSRPA